jgi:hypothetical protein
MPRPDSLTWRLCRLPSVRGQAWRLRVCSVRGSVRQDPNLCAVQSIFDGWQMDEVAADTNTSEYKRPAAARAKDLAVGKTIIYLILVL